MIVTGSRKPFPLSMSIEFTLQRHQIVGDPFRIAYAQIAAASGR
jgi:hypothetical protein